MPVQTGRFGNFDLHQRLAVGGMGELYVATRVGAPKRLLALKILLREYREQPDFVNMFEDEGRIGMNLAHRNIVGVQEVGSFEGTPFIVMEYVRGENLRSLLRRMPELDERVPPEIALRIGIDVALALEHAHRAKDADGNALDLVHRDLSPDNIVLSYDGDVKILDFGIAKASGRATHTQIGVYKGKGQYMSPEQARGEEVDSRSDLYALAVVILETITGEKRIKIDNGVQQIYEARNWKAFGPSEKVRGLPVELDGVLLKAMQADPERRWQTADSFAAALTRVLLSGELPTSKKGETLPGLLRRVFPDDEERESAAAAMFEPPPRAESSRGGAPEEPTVIRPQTRWASDDDEDPLSKTIGRPAANIAPLGDDRETTRAPDAARYVASPAPRRPVITEPSGRNVVEDPPFEMDADTNVGDSVTSTRDSITRSGDMEEDPTSEREAMELPFTEPDSAPRYRAQPARMLDLDPPQDPAWSRSRKTNDDPAGDTLQGGGPSRAVRRVEPRRKPPKRFRPFVFLFLMLILLVSSVGAAWTYREKLPPALRDPMEAFVARPDVQEEIAAIDAAVSHVGSQIGLLPPEPPPLDLVVVVTPAPLVAGSSGIAAMSTAGATPQPTSSSPAVATSTAIAVATPTSKPVATTTAVAKVTPVATRPHATPTRRPKDTTPATAAFVQIISKPAGLDVLVDGAPSGKKTPATVRLEPGSHVLSLEVSGFRPWSFSDTFAAGDTLHLQADLQPQ